MTARSSKKDQDNFEKIKREMAAKKKKAQARQSPEKRKAENDDLVTGSAENFSIQAQDTIETVVAKIDEGRGGSAVRKDLKVDAAARQDEKEGTVEAVLQDKKENPVKTVCQDEKAYSVDTARQDENENTVEIIRKDQKENAVDKKKIELVVFQVDEEEFAFRISNINEIIRIPSITKVPNVPQYITGLCSLSGNLLPIIDSRKLFGMPEQEMNESSRIIVADIDGKKAGLVSDRVLGVITVEETAIKAPPSGFKGNDGGIVNGILILNDGKRVVILLDAGKIIHAGNLDTAGNKQDSSVKNSAGSVNTEDEEEQIVIFRIGTGEYAFHVHDVKEIIRLPDMMKVPDTASHIEGVFSLRNQLLAAVNPGKLFGMNCKQPDENSRVVIIDNGSFSYGVIVDKVSHIARARKNLFKESGQIADNSGTGYIKGVFNLDNGKRLIMMPEPQKLISLEDVKGISDVEHRKMTNVKSSYDGDADNHVEYVVFTLGSEEYGIEIKNVREIKRVDDITRFPGAPSFIAGMVDIRGLVIPVLNLGKLFAVNDSDAYHASRLLVIESGNKRTGILVASVSEILRLTTDYLEDAPEALKGNDQERYIDKIAKLNNGNRMVLILNLAALLSFM